MSRLAVIDSGNIVVNIVRVPDGWTGQPNEWQPDAGFTAFATTDRRAQPGAQWDGQDFTPPVAPTVSDVEELQRQINALLVLFVRLCDVLLAGATIAPTDFSADVRSTYTRAKTIVDRLDPSS